MTTLKTAITQMINISEEEAEAFTAFCYRKSFKKKELLILQILLYDAYHRSIQTYPVQ